MRRARGLLVAIVLAVAVSAAAGPGVQVAAHRGGALLWPENSLLAFRNALALGTDLLELDVHLTADGELVVIHDPTLERTSTGTGAVGGARLADLAGTRLRARDGAVTDEPVPTLAWTWTSWYVGGFIGGSWTRADAFTTDPCGGFVALDYAAWHPERLSSLIVGASTGSVSDKEIQDVIRRIEIPGIRDLPAHFREVGASYRGTNPEGTKRWLDIHERARQKDAPTQPLRSPNTFAKLETITTRTLVISADADLLAPPGLMKLWARHLEGAQWTTVMDAGHSIAWEQPAAFNDIVLRFLQGGSPFPAVPQ